MSNDMRRLPLLRRPAQVADPGEMVDLQMEDGSWREGFRALSAPATAETGEVLVWVSVRRTSTGRLVGRTAVRSA